MTDTCKACQAELAQLRSEKAAIVARLEAADSITHALDFDPDKNYQVADMANCGRSLMEAIATHRPKYLWNNSPAEIVGDLCNEIEELKTNILALLSNVTRSYGEVRGRVEKFSVHGPDKNFYIYPRLGGKVKCVFVQELHDQAVAAVDKDVVVTGLLKSRIGQFLPYEVEVKKIEVCAPDDSLPTLSSFYGIAPDATGDIASEDFIRGLRDGWH